MADPSGTLPRDEDTSLIAHHVLVQDKVVDPTNGAMWVHQDLVKVKDAWADEAHIPPVHADEALGDVESWAEYVKRYSNLEIAPFLRWNAQGLLATLDYHAPTVAGRHRWHARYRFEHAKPFADWKAFANNLGRKQTDVVEFLEAHQGDIAEDSPVTSGDLVLLLRKLRTTVRKNFGYDVNEDGTARLEYNAETTAAARGGTIDVPPELAISVQVLKGHVQPASDPTLPPLPVPYRFRIRLRVAVDEDSSKPIFRFEMLNVERTLEDVYAQRVAEARQLLGNDFVVLRAADGS